MTILDPRSAASSASSAAPAPAPLTPGWPEVELASVVSTLPVRDVPGATLTNAGLSDLMARVPGAYADRGLTREVALSSPEFPEERLGVRSRGILDEAWSSRELAVRSAQDALAASGTDVADLRCILVSTVTPDRNFPALATSVHRALGAPGDAEAHDVTVGCSGFLVALGIATRRLAQEPEGATAVVVASETMVRLTDASDRTTCTIFGDGAGAVVLRRCDRGRLRPIRVWTLGEHGARIETRAADREGERAGNGDGRPEPLFRFTSRSGRLALEEDLVSRQRLVLDGRRVFRDMVRTLPGKILAYLDAEGLPLAAVDRFLFHQANQRMIDAVAAAPGLELPAERVLSNIAEVGNTASASLPILLAEATRTGRLAPGERALLVGFGSGYSIAIGILQWF